MATNCQRREELYKQFPEKFDLIDELHSLIEKHFGTQKVKFDGDTPAIKQLVWFLGVKGMKTFRAGKLLVEQGYGPDAMQLARSLAEIYVQIRFAKEEGTDERAIMYGEYEWVIKRKLWNKAGEHTSAFLTPEKQKASRDKIEREYERVCAKYGHFRGAGGAIPWTGSNVTDLFKKYGLPYHGEVLYTLASYHTHSTTTSMGAYFTEKTPTETMWNAGPSDDHIREAMGPLIDLTVRIIDEVADTFGFGIEDDLKAFIQKLNKDAEDGKENEHDQPRDQTTEHGPQKGGE